MQQMMQCHDEAQMEGEQARLIEWRGVPLMNKGQRRFKKAHEGGARWDIRVRSFRRKSIIGRPACRGSR